MGNFAKTAIKCFIALIFAIFFFLAGMLFEWMNLWIKEPVEVSITNKSGQAINSITLTYHGYRQSGQIKVTPTNEETINIKYFQAGEGAFEVEAILYNGQVVRGKGGYVESGYSFKKVITPSAVVDMK